MGAAAPQQVHVRLESGGCWEPPAAAIGSDCGIPSLVADEAVQID